MRARRALALAAAALLASAPALRAQGAGESGASTGPERSVIAPPGVLTERGRDTMMAGELGAVRVVTAAGEEVGDIEGTVLGRDGTVVAMLVGVGGVLGLAEKVVGVPYDRLAVRDTKDGFEFVTDLSRDELDAAPAYKEREE